jgi:endonuclease YncB( thermonuclease family)
MTQFRDPQPGQRAYYHAKIFRSLALAGLVAGSLPFAVMAQEAPARVIDGDTLDIAGERIRLHGIDAPEKDQTCTIDGEEWECGIAAWGYLVQLLAGQIVTCDPRDIDQYGRTVAVCFADNQDINAAMVADGWALAYREYSQDYVPHEAAAETAGLGLWQGAFVPPWEWRQGGRLDENEILPECALKGNIARGGERIYHVPGGRYYGVTVMNLEAGERWFCTEAEAVAAGWRRSLQ